MNYDKMTKAELIAALKSLQSTGRVGSDPAVLPSERTAEEWQRLVHELQVHQLELEMQNRELQEAQGLLEESRDRYADLYDFAPVGYVSLDEKGCIQEINLSGAALLGRERSQLIGKPFIHSVVQKDVKTVLDHLQRGREANEKVIAEVGLAMKGVESLRAQLISVRVQDAKHHTTLYRMTMLDITERKRAEAERDQLFARAQEACQEAEAANRAKDEFLAVVSHELRTPLTAILGWARMLSAANLDAVTTTRALESIDRNARAQAQLIEDLLDVSRIIAGKLQLVAQPVELLDIIKSGVETLQPAAAAKGLHVSTTLDPGTIPVVGDPNRLQQVVWNLLSNAIKFTPPGGRIEIRLARVGSQAELQVRDTGMGILAEFLPHVFERFRQADNTSTRVHSGLGLGLAIVRHLVELHEGTIQVESKGKGRGSIFTVRLPIARVGTLTSAPERGPRAAKPPVLSERPQALDGLRVLVVDDEVDTRALLIRVLEQRGAKALAVASVAEALAALEQMHPDVLVSDIGMPGEDGYDLIRTLRELPSERGGKIPAVALTAYAGVKDRMRMLSAGYQTYMTKPVEPAEIVSVVARAAGRAGKLD